MLANMKSTRRKFISTTLAGGLAAASMPLSSFGTRTPSSFSPEDLRARYAQLDDVLSRPVLKRELFPNPVIIESLDLLSYGNSFICRVRSTDGAEGISVAHNDIRILYPVFLNNIRPFFIGKDARELDMIIDKIHIYRLNFRYLGIAVGIPLATAEFAILDMLGRMAGKTMGELIGDVHNPEVGVYMATEWRERPLEETMELIKGAVAEYDVNALKIKVGYQLFMISDMHEKGPVGKTEKLIPLVRETFGDEMALYADSNGYYSVNDAIRVGKMLEEYRYNYFEEPVMFNDFEAIKKVKDALSIPVANGEQDQGFVNFRWLIANDGIDIVQPDNYYFGGFIRSMQVARMADAFGKTIIPHMSGGALGYLYNILFVSVVPNAGLHHEFKGLGTHVPFECATSPLKVTGGKIKVPTGPGSGIEIDPDFIKKHQVARL
jgi:L-alanine-DL-glutamate epimerase-like enolase superfamily enzyme